MEWEILVRNYNGEDVLLHKKVVLKTEPWNCWMEWAGSIWYQMQVVIRFKFHTSGQSSYHKQSAESLFTYCDFWLFATIYRLLNALLHSMLLVLISNQRKNESTINTTKRTKCKSDWKGVSSIWHITITTQFNTFKCILPDHSTVSLTTPGYTIHALWTQQLSSDGGSGLTSWQAICVATVVQKCLSAVTIPL